MAAYFGWGGLGRHVVVCWFPNHEAFRVHPPMYLDSSIGTRRRQWWCAETDLARDNLKSRGRSRLDFACAGISWGGHVRNVASRIAFVIESRKGSRCRS